MLSNALCLLETLIFFQQMISFTSVSTVSYRMTLLSRLAQKTTKSLLSINITKKAHDNTTVLPYKRRKKRCISTSTQKYDFYINLKCYFN